MVLANMSQDNHREGLVAQALTSVQITKPFSSTEWPVDKPGRAIFDAQTSSSDQPGTLNNSIRLIVWADQPTVTW